MNLNQEFDISKIENFESNDKKSLINQAITKILEDKEINISLKNLLLNKQYSKNHEMLINEVINRVEKNDIPTLDYLQTRFLFLPRKTSMTQSDLASLIKDNFIKENIVNRFYNIMKSDDNNPIKLKNFFDEMSNQIVDLEEVKMASFSDEERMEKALKKMRDKSNNVYFGGMSPFNSLSMQTGQLIGVLGASGHGKSWTLQKLHAESKKDVVLHFSLELSEMNFIRRIILCLGWIPDDKIETLTDTEIFHWKLQLAKHFPKWFYTCQDTDTSIINVSKIEKMVKYYRNLFPDEKIKVFIDYVQLLADEFDPNSCRVNQKLHEIAVRYNACIIEGIQANDEGTKQSSKNIDKNGQLQDGRPPELSHIAFVKSLKNDCDIIISQCAYNLTDSEDGQTLLTFNTKKHRNNKACNFIYKINSNDKDSWKMIKSSHKRDPHINLESGEEIE